MPEQHRGATDNPHSNAELDTTTAKEPTWVGNEQHGDVETRGVIGLTDALDTMERGVRIIVDDRLQRRILRYLKVFTVGVVGLEIPAVLLCAAQGWISQDLATATVGSTASPIGLCWLLVVFSVFSRRHDKPDQHVDRR